ncbi:hypothetical protein KBB25_01110 [Candidatus Gracilibacteria bacterium]|nr:hypothetical protein [Candidatus Gracilibacteria bacterium]
MEKHNLSTGNITSQEKISAALAYIFFLIPLVFDKKTDFVSFHMVQSFGLFLIGIITWFIPFLGGIIKLFLFFLILFLMWKAYSGEKFKLGELYEFSHKLVEKIGMTQVFFGKK